MTKMSAKEGLSAIIHYTGRLKDGTIFGTTKGSHPFIFTLGHSQVVEGLDKAVMGMNVGEKKSIELPPEMAYGPYNHNLLIKISSAKIPPNAKPGDVLATPQNEARKWEIKEIKEDYALLDGNHPLAGEDILFDIELIDVRRPSLTQQY